MANSPLAGGASITQTAVVDPKTGKPTWGFTKWLQDVQLRVQAGLDQLGQLIATISADAKISGRSEGIGTTVQNLTSAGQLNSLTNVASNVDLDHISDTVSYARTSPNQVNGADIAYQLMVASTPARGQSLVFNGAAWNVQDVSTEEIVDGPGNPLAGGEAAYTALVASGPLSGKALVYNGTNWTPQDVSSIAGSVDASQVPPLNDLSGAITTVQLPANVPVTSFGSGAPVGSSTEGYQYFDISAAPFHGYVYHSGAWHQFS